MKANPGMDFLPHFQLLCAKAADFLELTKPKLTTLVLFTTFVGFCIGSQGSIRLGLLISTLVGTALIAGGAAALNMYAERGADAMMKRTTIRPLAAGRLTSGPALIFAIGISAAGFAYLHFFVNHLTSLLSAIIFAGYLFLYTPLKVKTWLCTIAGAVPGALPIVMGWSGANATLSPRAWVLFLVVFLWQIPHFYSIGWMHREDYIRAGFPILSAIDASGRRTGRQVVLFISILIPCTLSLAHTKICGWIYPAGAIVLGSIFLFYGISFAKQLDHRSARRLFVVSTLYLPALFLLLLIDCFSAR
jgi:protoheme IX farnesyltransferase